MNLHRMYCRRPSCRLLLLLGAVLIGGARVQPAQADVLWMKSGDARWGRVVAQTDDQITWLPWQENDWGATEIVDRNQVDQWRVNFDGPRLSRLAPEAPAEYLQYAEELARERRDPTARRLAIRLYLQTAWLADRQQLPELRASSLQALANLATEPDRRRSIQRLIALTDPANAVADVTVAANTKTAWPSEQRATALKLVRHLRRRESQAALAMLQDADTRDALRPWSDQLPLSSLQTMARQAPTPTQRRQLLTLELQLLPVDGVADGTIPPFSNRWSEQAARSARNATPLPSLFSITEFDPSETDYSADRFDY